MRRIILFAIIALAPLSFALAQRPNHAPNENLQHEQEIRKLLDEFAQAFAQVDTAVLQSLIADDYVHTNLTGEVLNKAQWLERAKMRRADISAGKTKIEHYSYDDIRIRIYDNTAVVTGQATTLGLQEGKEFKSNLRFTNVRVKREGRWQRVAFHDSNVATP
ncbi:MAG: nuclear transport factor 2 family protein [bacterium]